MTDRPAALPASPSRCRRLLCDRAGAVVLEYALIGGLVAVMAIGALLLFTNSTTAVWTTIAQEIGGALGG